MSSALVYVSRGCFFTYESNIWIHSYYKNFNNTDQAPFVHLPPHQFLLRGSHQFTVGPSWPFTTAVCNLNNTIFTNWVTLGFAPKLYHLAWSATSFIRVWLGPKIKSILREQIRKRKTCHYWECKIISLEKFPPNDLQALKVISKLFWAITA